METDTNSSGSSSRKLTTSPITVMSTCLTSAAHTSGSEGAPPPPKLARPLSLPGVLGPGRGLDVDDDESGDEKSATGLSGFSFGMPESAQMGLTESDAAAFFSPPPLSLGTRSLSDSAVRGVS
jgi:hypothetical protein